MYKLIINIGRGNFRYTIFNNPLAIFFFVCCLSAASAFAPHSMHRRNIRLLHPVQSRNMSDTRSDVTNIRGQVVTTTDYNVRWNNALVGSTHELTVNPKDPQWVWVTEMMESQLAKIDSRDPTKQLLFKFEEDSQPHTVRFDNEGRCWVGLENDGRIVQIKESVLAQHVDKPNAFEDEPTMITLTEDDFECSRDVQFGTGDDGFVNTHPHAFCFDRDQTNIWFTGKLTNTVGSLNIASGKVKHYEIPTLGAVPIYVSLGPDLNVWGTCLTSNRIVRVTTGDDPKNPEPGLVSEIPITEANVQSRPIIIEARRDANGNFLDRDMWFSNEAGHSVARVNVDKVQELIDVEGHCHKGKPSCTCSAVFYSATPLTKAVVEFPVPLVRRNMNGGGLAFDDEGNIWFQSYVDTTGGHGLGEGPDYIVKIDKSIHESQGYDRGQITNIPMTFYEIPTRDSTMHRIIFSHETKKLWFTELKANRIGTIDIQS